MVMRGVFVFSKTSLQQLGWRKTRKQNQCLGVSKQSINVLDYLGTLIWLSIKSGVLRSASSAQIITRYIKHKSWKYGIEMVQKCHKTLTNDT